MVFLSLCSWMEDLSLLAIFYWIIAIPSSAVFLIQLVLSYKNPESKKTNADNNSALKDKDITFQPFNFRNIIGFFVALGWSGLACIDSGLSNGSTILVSFICGVAMMFAMATIIYFMGKLLKSISEELD